jgi:hypothetical protein
LQQGAIPRATQAGPGAQPPNRHQPCQTPALGALTPPEAAASVNVTLAALCWIWFTAGGFADLREMLRRLQVESRVPTDDGFVSQGGRRDT